LCITQALHHAATPLRFTRLSATRGHTSVGRAPSCRRRTRPDPGHSEVLSGKPDTGSQNARRIDPYDEKPTQGICVGRAKHTAHRATAELVGHDRSSNNVAPASINKLLETLLASEAFG